MSTVSGSNPAARNAANAASWWSRASGPVRRNASDAQQGSTTIVRPSDSTTQNAWPTRTSVGLAHQVPTAQGSAAISASVSATASGGSVTSKYGTRVRRTAPTLKRSHRRHARHPPITGRRVRRAFLEPDAEETVRRAHAVSDRRRPYDVRMHSGRRRPPTTVAVAAAEAPVPRSAAPVHLLAEPPGRRRAHPRVDARVVVRGGVALRGVGRAAVRHVGRVPPRPVVAAIRERMQRADHAMIFVLIAGSYTPIVLLALQPAWGITLLAIAWTVAVVGVTLTFTHWNFMDRHSGYLYVAFGWVMVVALPVVFEALSRDRARPALRRRRPLHGRRRAVRARSALACAPRTFGFHELWHVMTVAAAGCHYALDPDARPDLSRDRAPRCVAARHRGRARCTMPGLPHAVAGGLAHAGVRTRRPTAWASSASSGSPSTRARIPSIVWFWSGYSRLGWWASDRRGLRRLRRSRADRRDRVALERRPPGAAATRSTSCKSGATRAPRAASTARPRNIA